MGKMNTRSVVPTNPVGITLTTPKFQREESFRRSTFVVFIDHHQQSKPPKLEIAAMVKARLNLPETSVIYLSKFRTIGPHSRGYGLAYDTMEDAQKYEPPHKLRKMGVP
ncbi:hypothetical protein KI387_028544, partial [Taxus chinensis]